MPKVNVSRASTRDKETAKIRINELVCQGYLPLGKSLDVDLNQIQTCKSLPPTWLIVRCPNFFEQHIFSESMDIKGKLESWLRNINFLTLSDLFSSDGQVNGTCMCISGQRS